MIPGPTHSKASSRSSAYHHKALAEIRNSLLPFAATPLQSDSASVSSASSVSSGYTHNQPNGLDNKDLALYTARLVQMGYSEELSARAVKQACGRFDVALDILKQLHPDSHSINGINKLNSSPGSSVVGTKVKRKSSLEREVNIRASPAVDSGAGSSRSDSPRQGLVDVMSHGVVGRGQYSPSSFLEVPPPPPPPRTSATPPPPPPPHTYPSNVQQLLKRMSPCQPGASAGAVAHTRGTSPVSRQPMVVQNSPQVQQQLSQQMQALSLYGGAEPPPPYHLVPPPPPPSYTASIVSRQSPTQQDYRKSPSSGIYSGSGGSPSPVTVCGVVPSVVPAWSVSRQAKSQHPVIMHSVKSTQVQKPVLQTATAPPSPPPPPPYKPTIVPTTEPPSYASTMQALAQAAQVQAQRSDQSLLVTTVESSLSKFHPHSHHPPPPQRKYSPVESEYCVQPSVSNTPPPPPSPAPKSNGISPGPGGPSPSPSTPNQETPSTSKQPPSSGGQRQGGKIDHQSPIPERKHVSKEKEEERRDCKVRNYSPQAFKFYMEQHVENVLKSHKQRLIRRMQLEKEMTKIGLSSEAQMQMRKMLSQKESNYIRLKRAKMDKSMFVKLKAIGVGAFGEVTLVRKIDTNHLYAMKTLRKADVLKRNQVAHVKAERDILAEADNEWVVKLYYSFQDKDNLYFVMDYIPGGDLMSLLIKLGIFEEHLARFYIAELSCAVESVHKMGFIHRDIKPDNILIDKDGHIKLTDFGLCTGFRWTHNSKYYQRNGEHCRQDSMEVSEDWSGECQCGGMKPLERRRKHQRCLAHSLVGTPNYIAPEVLLRTGYTQLCDWWSVGVILYEMLVGSPPFLANTPGETQYKVIHWETTLQIPKAANLTKEASDLILKLCTGADRRLGKNAQEVKQHPFFRNIDFERGVRRLTPPHIPRIKHSTDTSNFDPIDPDKLRNSSSDSSQGDEFGTAGRPPFHGFFEFTFRRFFDDGAAVPYQTKITLDDNENQGAVYV